MGDTLPIGSLGDIDEYVDGNEREFGESLDSLGGPQSILYQNKGAGYLSTQDNRKFTFYNNNPLRPHGSEYFFTDNISTTFSTCFSHLHVDADRRSQTIDADNIKIRQRRQSHQYLESDSCSPDHRCSSFHGTRERNYPVMRNDHVKTGPRPTSFSSRNYRSLTKIAEVLTFGVGDIPSKQCSPNLDSLEQHSSIIGGTSDHCVEFFKEFSKLVYSGCTISQDNINRFSFISNSSTTIKSNSNFPIDNECLVSENHSQDSVYDGRNLIWLEIQAMFHDKDVEDHDDWLCNKREALFEQLRDDIKEFKCEFLSNTHEKGNTYMANVSLTLKRVHVILENVDCFNSLFPSFQTMCQMNDDYFTFFQRYEVKFDALQLWYNVTNELLSMLTEIKEWIGIDNDCMFPLFSCTESECQCKSAAISHSRSSSLPSCADTSKESIECAIRSVSCPNAEFSVYRAFVEKQVNHIGLHKLFMFVIHKILPTLTRVRSCLTEPEKPTCINVNHDSIIIQCPPWCDYWREIMATYRDIFDKLCLPTFLPLFSYLVLVPVQLMHQCIKVKLENHNGISVSRLPLVTIEHLVREYKDLIVWSITIKRYYQTLTVFSNTNLGPGPSPNYDIDDFDQDLKVLVNAYLDVLHQWAAQLQLLPQASLALKNVLEEEWESLKKYTCFISTELRLELVKRFCAISCELFTSVGDYVSSEVPIISSSLIDFTFDASLPSNLSKAFHKFKDIFVEGGLRRFKVIGLARLLIEELEVISRFEVLNVYHLLGTLLSVGYKKLVSLYDEPINDAHIFVKTNDALQIPNTFNNTKPFVKVHHLFRECCVVVLCTPKYCTIDLPCDDGWPNDILTGNIFFDLPFSISKANGVELILLAESRRMLYQHEVMLFQELKNVVNMSFSGGNDYLYAYENLSNVRKSALLFCEKVIEMICGMESTMRNIPWNQNLSAQSSGIITQAYLFGFDCMKDVHRLIGRRRRKTIAQLMLRLAHSWMKFVLHYYEQGSGYRPRWAEQGLQFLCYVVSPLNTSTYTAAEYRILTDTMERTIIHIIGHKVGKSIDKTEPLDYLREVSKEKLPSMSNKKRPLVNDLSDSPVTREQRVNANILFLESSRQHKLMEGGVIGVVVDRPVAGVNSILSKRVTFKWERGRLLGRGQFGNVYECIRKTDSMVMAVKELDISLMRYSNDANDDDVIDLAEELHSLEGLKHRHIAHYFGVEIHPKMMRIFMEYCGGGTLEGVAYSSGGLSLIVVQRYTKQLVEGVSFLHKHHIIHRDIKSANILLTAEDQLKIGDFGSCKSLRFGRKRCDEERRLVGTVPFIAPEAMRDSSKGVFASDIWSCGCVVIEMLTGRRPWHKLEVGHIMYRVGLTSSHPDIPDELPDTAVAFLGCCFEKDPAIRATSNDLLLLQFLCVSV